MLAIERQHRIAALVGAAIAQVRVARDHAGDAPALGPSDVIAPPTNSVATTASVARSPALQVGGPERMHVAAQHHRVARRCVASASSSRSRDAG